MYHPYGDEDDGRDGQDGKQNKKENNGNNGKNSILNKRRFVEPCLKEYEKTNVHPRKTNMACWWDGHQFDTKPIMIPKEMVSDG